MFVYNISSEISRGETEASCSGYRGSHRGQHFKVIDDSQALKSFLTRYKLPSKFILAFGSTDPRKNTLNILAAYAKMLKKKSDVPLVLIGAPSGMIASVARKLDSPDLKNKVIALGYVKNYELPYIYNAADLFIFPSLRESFGIPVLEAMACGTPVITSNTSSLPEVAGNA